MWISWRFRAWSGSGYQAAWRRSPAETPATRSGNPASRAAKQTYAARSAAADAAAGRGDLHRALPGHLEEHLQIQRPPPAACSAGTGPPRTPYTGPPARHPAGNGRDQTPTRNAQDTGSCSFQHHPRSAADLHARTVVRSLCVMLPDLSSALAVGKLLLWTRKVVVARGVVLGGAGLGSLGLALLRPRLAHSTPRLGLGLRSSWPRLAGHPPGGSAADGAIASRGQADSRLSAGSTATIVPGTGSIPRARPR
jgi:hypothetical protein